METHANLHYLSHMDRMDKTELYTIMTLYGDDVRKYIYSITGNHEQAKDIAQEVFIKVYQSIGLFKGKSSLKTWLFAIARNLTVNELRSSYMRRVVLFEWVRPRKMESSAEDIYLERDAERELRKVILALPMKYREVLVLHLEHELTMAEIGQLLNLPEGTIKSRLHRARKMVESKWRG